MLKTNLKCEKINFLVIYIFFLYFNFFIKFISSNKFNNGIEFIKLKYLI